MSIADIQSSVKQDWSHIGETCVQNRDPATRDRIFAVVRSTGLGAPVQAVFSGKPKEGLEL